MQPLLWWEGNEYHILCVCVCVFVALGIQHAMRMRHIANCNLPRSKIIFPHYLTNGTIFEKKVTEHKMCVLIFCTTFAWNIFHSENK